MSHPTNSTIRMPALRERQALCGYTLGALPPKQCKSCARAVPAPNRFLHRCINHDFLVVGQGSCNDFAFSPPVLPDTTEQADNRIVIGPFDV